MSLVTVLTPTYNRGEHLGHLYQSLCGQINKDFEWLVVDDGSVDDTQASIRGWSKEEKLAIRYIHRENGGKHRALNDGIKEINSALTFIVDSDDYLPPDAVDIIARCHRRYGKAEGICGYSFLRFHSDGTVNTAYFPQDGIIDTYLKVRINGGIGGDKAEVFLTDILKQYPFPVFSGEKFLPEDVVWMQMSGKYKMVHLNECIYICDYLEGGLTRSGRNMKLHSPKGMVLRSGIYLNNKEVCFRVRIKMMLLYHVYGKAAGYRKKELMKQINDKLLYVLCMAPAWILYRMWTGRL